VQNNPVIPIISFFDKDCSFTYGSSSVVLLFVCKIGRPGLLVHHSRYGQIKVRIQLITNADDTLHVARLRTCSKSDPENTFGEELLHFCNTDKFLLLLFQGEDLCTCVPNLKRRDSYQRFSTQQLCK
jgi:hypothetical protein